MLYSENYSSSMDKKYHTTQAENTMRNIYFSAPTPASDPGKQVTSIINLAGSGLKNVEIGQLASRGNKSWETIPKQHFDMIRQTAKLTMGDKAVVSVHAPIDVDPTGFKENRWSEDNRVDAENFMKDVIDKASMVQVDKTRPVPIAYHASGQTGTFWKWNDNTNVFTPETAMAVIPDTGEVLPLRTETKTYPGGEKVHYVPYKVDGVNYPEPNTVSSLEQVNHTLWQREQEKISQMWKEIQEAEKETIAAKNTGDEITASRWAERGKLMTSHLNSAISATYDKLAETDKAAKEFIDNTTGGSTDPNVLTHAINLLGVPGGHPTPKMVRLVEEFGQEKAAETIANLAKYSYEKYGENGPQMAIENWDPWHVMGRGEDLKKGLNLARTKFVEKIIAEQKIPRKKAEEVANKLIGATWDIAHINLTRGFGFPDMPKDKKWETYIKKEVEAIKDDIRHIHISDNFGYGDAHLAPGMGNVPIEEFLEYMKKHGKLKNVTSVLESAGTAIHLGIPPVHTEALQTLGVGSPAWSISPNWYESSQNYFFGGSNYASAGFGNILPQGHFSEYGAGFSQLPTATGGIRPGQQSKFSNTPMS